MLKKLLCILVLAFAFGCTDDDPTPVIPNPDGGKGKDGGAGIVVDRNAGAEKESPLCEVKGGEKKEIDMKCIEDQLKGDGLGGWVHASVSDQLMLVFTWRRPKSFFVNLQLPMVSEDPAVMKQLTELKRHDRIVIKGEFLKNKAPIQHINVSELKIVETYEGPSEKYEYDPALPGKILSGTSMIAKVHVVANGGSVLVVETGDRVYPVVNPKPELAKDLYRNDKIEIQYKVRGAPDRPDHLVLNVAAAEPVRMIQPIVEGHEEEMTLTGSLVMFPESPQINRNIFAIREDDGDGIRRNYTIFGQSETIEIFENLQKIWDKHVDTMKYDRNKYINPQIQVTVTGLKNVVSKTQANPQIMPEDGSQVEVEILD